MFSSRAACRASVPGISVVLAYAVGTHTGQLDKITCDLSFFRCYWYCTVVRSVIALVLRKELKRSRLCFDEIWWQKYDPMKLQMDLYRHFCFLLDIRWKTNSHVKYERDGPYSSRTPLSWIGQPGSRTPNSKRLGPDVHVQPAQPEPQCQSGADVPPHGQSGYDHDFLIYLTFLPPTVDSTTTWTKFYPILTSHPPSSCLRSYWMTPYGSAKMLFFAQKRQLELNARSPTFFLFLSP